MSRRISPIFLASGLFCILACGVEEAGPGPNNERPGKADAVVLVNGASISSNYVDPSLHYMSHRSVYNLAEVKALTGAMEGVAYRVDGIIANLPADDYISIEEMEQMEKPDYFATLFDDEKDAFKLLWKLLEIPDQQPIQLTMPAALDLTVTDKTVAPTALAFPPSELIDTLPENLKLPARRLQLVFDTDSDADTVTFEDVDLGENDTLGRFTQYDVVLFGKIRDELRKRGTSEAEARIEVPTPGEFDHDLVVGDLTLRVTQSINYKEYRRQSGRYSGGWSIGITQHHKTEVIAQLADEVSALLINEATDDEMVLSDGEIVKRIPESTYFVELWKNGQRIATTRALLPEMTGDTGQETLSQYADHSFYTPAGDKLVRNAVEARFKSSSYVGATSYYWATFSYDLISIPAEPGKVSHKAIQEVSTFKTRLPPGRYEPAPDANIGKFFIDIYPEGVIYTERQGTRQWMVPCQLDRKKKFDGGVGNGRVVLNPSDSKIWLRKPDGTSLDLTLDRLQRI